MGKRGKNLIKNARGFTLVEFAIVLVLIGIILGAVLKGQELINNAKIKRAYNQQREIIAGIYTYYDRYGLYPGDDNTAVSRWTTTGNSPNGNGLIEGFDFSCGNSTNTETCQIWRHLRYANIITGDQLLTQNPTSAYGGTIGVGTPTLAGFTSMWVGMQNITYDVCQSLDRQYDDGHYNTGSIRSDGDYMIATSGTFNLYFKI